MTQKEFDLRMQELRLQYVKELNEIETKRDKIERKRDFRINADEKDFYAYKFELMKKINDSQTERANLVPDDQRRDVLSAVISSYKTLIEARRQDMIVGKNAVIEDAKNELRTMDNKARKLKEWFESEKLKAMQELMATESKTE